MAVANGHPITNYTAAYVCLREDLNFSTGAQAVYRNGAAVTLSSTTFSLTEANVAGEEGAFLGCQIVGAGPRRYWEGDIADIIVTNGIISTADWAAYKIWAAGKYGLTFS